MQQEGNKPTKTCNKNTNRPEDDITIAIHFCSLRPFQWSASFTDANQSPVSVKRQIVGTGWCDTATSTESPICMVQMSFPSTLSAAPCLAVSGTVTVTVADSGSKAGRNDSECGETGVRRMAGTAGCTPM